ncbi:MAG TPA: tetratricopeptide repeat protein [Syntrophales bacterium]|nr:tetratricopeptide repeat protein [Syntrophales bacterium]
MHIQSEKQKKLLTIIPVLAIIVISLVLFSPVRNFDFVMYDDDQYVTGNKHVRSGLNRENIVWAFTAVHASNWHPLTWISHMTDVQLFGMQAGSHHVVNAIFHALNAALLYLFLWASTGAVGRSMFVALLFAVHPLHVESVAWIAERKDVLSTFFLLLTLLAYTRYSRRPQASTYLLVLLLFALGLLSKPMLVTLPFVLLLLDFWPLRRYAPGVISLSGAPDRPGLKRLVLEKTPLFLLSGASIAATLYAQQAEISFQSYIPFGTRTANALSTYGEYIFRTFWPHPLAVLYPYPAEIPAAAVIASGILIAGLTAAALKTARNHPYIATGWFWYLGTLVPVIGLVQVGVQSMADRYTYIPLIGIFIAVVWTAGHLAERISRAKLIVPALGAAAVIALSAATWRHLPVWKTSEALFKNALSATTGNYVIHGNMGALLASTGKDDEALAHYGEALRIKPDDADTHYNIGNILARRGQTDEAVSHYREAIRFRPDSAGAHNNLGIALGRKGDNEGAIAHFREAIRINPGFEDALKNLQVAMNKMDKTKRPSAVEQTAGITEGTENRDVRAGLEMVRKGDLDAAVRQFRKALNANPDSLEALTNLGLALAHQGKIDEAIPFFRKALKIKPELPEVHNSLGVALARTGKTDEAVSHLRQAIRINPKFAKAHNSLGVILARTGRAEEGLNHLEQAVRLQPNYEEAKRNLQIVRQAIGR